MLTQERLKELLDYDPETGVFTRVTDSSNRRFKAGATAGAVSKNGRYRQQWIDGRPYLEHRVAWLWMTGKFPEHQIDHVNLDKCDNRWENLRESTISQNAMNRSGRARSGAKGVYFVNDPAKCGSKPWRSSICKDGRIYVLGLFYTREDAAAAYAVAASRLHGEFARVT
jgi:hypothetical protein